MREAGSCLLLLRVVMKEPRCRSQQQAQEPAVAIGSSLRHGACAVRTAALVRAGH